MRKSLVLHRFIKFRQRRLNKFNILINKKQGNITRANATIWSNNLGPQSGRQASASPLGEGNNTTQTNSQAGAPLPSREASNPSQAITPVSSQVPGIPPNSIPAIAHLPSGEGSNSLPAAAHLPLGEGSSSSQAIAHLPSREGDNSSQATALLPSSEGSSSSQAIAHLPSGVGSNSSQATALLPSSEGNSIPQATNSPQAGQISNPTRSVRQGHRHPPGTGHPSLPRRIAPSPGKTTPLLPLPVAPQGSSKEEPNPKWVINLSNKPLTPAQRSVLAKGPNFVVTPRQPPNLEYITAIEAACTKLSQQDAEELRADINRVLRSSHPPNLI